MRICLISLVAAQMGYCANPGFLKKQEPEDLCDTSATADPMDTHGSVDEDMDQTEELDSDEVDMDIKDPADDASAFDKQEDNRAAQVAKVINFWAAKASSKVLLKAHEAHTSQVVGNLSSKVKKVNTRTIEESNPTHSAGDSSAKATEANSSYVENAQIHLVNASGPLTTADESVVTTDTMGRSNLGAQDLSDTSEDYDVADTADPMDTYGSSDEDTDETEFDSDEVGIDTEDPTDDAMSDSDYVSEDDYDEAPGTGKVQSIKEMLFLQDADDGGDEEEEPDDVSVDVRPDSDVALYGSSRGEAESDMALYGAHGDEEDSEASLLQIAEPIGQDIDDYADALYYTDDDVDDADIDADNDVGDGSEFEDIDAPDDF
jgi:hypothetical protein